MIISGGRLLLSERDRAAGADAADRRVLPLAGAGLRRRARSRSCSRAAAATARAASATSTRPAASSSCRTSRRAQFDGMPQDRARRRRGRLRARAAGDAAASLVEHVGRARRARRAGAHATGAEPQRHRRRLPDARERVRHRLHALQAEHGHAPHRAAARSSRESTTSTSTSQRLRSERDELDVLYRDLLIGVTRFFRDRRRSRSSSSEVLARAAGAACRADAPLRVVGRGLRDRRGGVLARDPAARADRRSAASVQRQDLRDRRPPRLARARRRAAIYARTRVANVSPRAARALLHPHAATATRSCPSCGRWSCSRSTT